MCKKTVQVLVNKKSFREKLKLFKNDLDIEPLHFSRSSFWSNLNTLRIVLYFDEIEPKVALGPTTGNFKVGQFYFSIFNLTRKHNSSLNNILCVASAFAQDIKKYNIICQVFVP